MSGKLMMSSLQCDQHVKTVQRFTIMHSGTGGAAEPSTQGEMAQKGIQVDQDKLCCSVRLDLLKDPVTIPCGHSYCLSCIRTYWDAEGHKGNSCPQCRQTFTQRPALVKNTLLADLVEDLKRTGLQAAPAALCYATHQDVACDSCTGRKLKATKSCLQCLVSYCDQHLQPHYESPAFEKHQLVDPCEKLQENICTRHNEVMKAFCRTDQQCICYLCSMDEHKGHDTVSAAAERTEKQKKLSKRQQTIQQKIKDREGDIKKLQQEVETINQSADEAERSSEKIFTRLIQLVQDKCSDVKQQIRSQRTSLVNRLKESQKELEEGLTEIKRREAELQQLSHTHDPIQFLHHCPVLLNPMDSTDPHSISIQSVSYFDHMLAAVAAATDKIQDVLNEEWTWSEFLQYSQQMTLDPNTAHTQLMLFKGNRKATVMKNTLVHPHHPDRFIKHQQVLGAHSLTGRHYWEVQMKQNKFRTTVAVTYKNSSRTQSESAFGDNNRSWALVLLDNRFKIMHNGNVLFIPGPPSSRIGVFLDHGAGTLSFYRVSDTMTLLQRVQTTFTEPLYAGLSVYGYDMSVELCELK
ncbi:tripartite motif-containing protein 16-like isoform X2 [Betta splendens]|uniref:Tripartite motif-containing protein 16-like isoform X2 n=1 Tax=Betta splendens TaxID=158456 RepID=A0A6P7P6S1_BETSP|nr:tripartite motif-containing protein 16-like isoform X2 [Betta splendens]